MKTLIFFIGKYKTFSLPITVIAATLLRQITGVFIYHFFID